MAKHQRKFRLEVLTPEAAVCATDAVSAVIPAADGQIGILGGHAPLLALMGSGRLTVTDGADKTRRFFVAGGFAHVREDFVSILAEEGVPLEKLDFAKAAADLERAHQMPQDTAEAIERRKETLAVCKARLRIAKEFKEEMSVKS